MRITRHVARVAPPSRPRVLAVGRFDGVHLGHQRVLERCRMRAQACGGEVVVALRGVDGPRLASWRERVDLLRSAGVDHVVMAGPTGADGDELTLARAIRARVVVAGRPLAGATGDPAVDSVAAVTLDGQRIETEAIRGAIERGDLAAAARMLGRDHAVSGRVIHGHHRGTGLGIPTANLRVRDVQLPPDGVYAVRARIGTAEAYGVANIGFNPTFGNRDRSLETHLLDFSGDIYGQRLRVAFVEHLRGERKFAGVEALLQQIHNDIRAARRLFDRHGG